MVRPRLQRARRNEADRAPSRRADRPRRRRAPEPIDEERFPNLAALERGDRLEHVRRARAMGATRKQASEHADLEVGGH